MAVQKYDKVCMVLFQSYALAVWVGGLGQCEFVYIVFFGLGVSVDLILILQWDYSYVVLAVIFNEGTKNAGILLLCSPWVL